MGRMASVLLIDDEVSFTAGLAELLRTQGHGVTTGDSLGGARALLARDPDAFDVLLIDLMLPDGNGLELLDEIEHRPSRQVVLMTGHESIKRSIRHLHGPGIKYLIKPIDFEELDRIVSLSDVAESHCEVPPSPHHLGVFLGESGAMLKLYQQIEQVAPMDSTVLIIGESGTGKELVAEAIHRESGRPGSLVPVNCGALSSELLASELFGHEPGSFTGARKRHLGVFERASGGTLFLDEITEMPSDQQPHLLRAIESGQVTRVGGEELIDVQPRLIAASNRELASAIADGHLREDLYFRLSVFPIEVPPLRARGKDVELLAESFLHKLNQKYRKQRVLDAAVRERLMRWSWPGNVRELKHVIHRAFISTVGDNSVLALPDQFDTPFGRPENTIEAGRTVHEVEKDLILATIEHFNGNRKQAAEMLGISVKTLYNRMVEYENN